MKGTLAALGLVVLAVVGAALVRTHRPDVPAGVVLGCASVVAALGLLLPSFRRIAAVEFLFENDIFFVSGVVGALVWANLAPGSYEATLAPLHFAVNDVLMTLFFGIAAKEVRESLLPGGPLSSWKKAAMPLAATAGGMGAPALVYLAGAYAFGAPALVRGWAIPTATDIAFCALVARIVFGARHPAIPFLLLLAIADDAGGLVILAVAYPQHELRPGLLAGLVGLGVALGLILNRAKVASPWPYLLLGGVPAWFGLHEGGVHPALALVPIIPTLPHGARDAGIFTEGAESDTSTLHRFEEVLAAPVSLILAVFGLVNAGISIGGAGKATALVLGGLLLGKPLGIFVTVLAGRKLGLALPEGLGLRDVLVLGVTAGIGFTVALFVATVALGGSADLNAAKMGALGSVAAAPLALILGRLVRIERRP